MNLTPLNVNRALIGLTLLLSCADASSPDEAARVVSASTGVRIYPGSATATSTYQTNAAVSAIDGNPSTHWLASGGPSQAITLDLGDDYVITKVRLLTEQAPAGRTAHVVEGLAPIATEEAVQFGIARGQTSTAQWIEIDITEPRAFRQVRVRTTESPSWVGWREIELFGVLRSSLPVVAASASSSYGANVPANAVDGDPATVWNSGGAAPRWLRVDLGANKIISKARMLVEQSPAGQTTHVLEGSLDGVTFYTLGTLTQSTSPGMWIEIPAAVRGEFRYARIRTTQSPSWVAWAEVRVYGDDPATLTPVDSSASSTYAANLPMNAFDGQYGTQWLANGYPTQHLSFALRDPAYLTHLRLMISQSPAGAAKHRVYGANDTHASTLLGTFTTNGGTGSWHDAYVQLSAPYRYFRIETISNPGSWVGWVEVLAYGKSDPPPCAATVGADRLQHYTYFQTEVPPNGAAMPGSYTAEVADHADLGWIQVTAWDSIVDPATPNTSLDVARLQNLPPGKKAVLMITGLFFEDFRLIDDVLVPGGQPKYVRNWNAYADAIAPYIDSVAAFYPIDEPYHNGRKPEYAVPEATMKTQLETVSALIKARFSEKPIAVMFNYNELPTLAMPAQYDWVGFDCYAHWQPTSVDPWSDCAGLSIPNHIALLRSAMRPEQHMFLVPDAFVPAPDPVTVPIGFDATISLEDRVRLEYVAERYARFAQSDGRILGVVPFLWRYLPAAGADWDMRGVRSLGAATRAKFASFGTCITGP